MIFHSIEFLTKYEEKFIIISLIYLYVILIKFFTIFIFPIFYEEMVRGL